MSALHEALVEQSTVDIIPTDCGRYYLDFLIPSGAKTHALGRTLGLLWDGLDETKIADTEIKAVRIAQDPDTLPSPDEAWIDMEDSSEQAYELARLRDILSDEVSIPDFIK